MKSWRRPRKSWRSRNRRKVRPREKGGPGGGATVHGYVHGKLYEVEHENVGTESAHRSELVGEAALRSTSRYVKSKSGSTRPKRCKKAESGIKATADYQYRPRWRPTRKCKKGGAVSRYIKSRKSSGNTQSKRGRLQSRRPRPPKKRQSPRKAGGPGRGLCQAASRGGCCCSLPVFLLAGAHAVVYVLCGDDWQRRGGAIGASTYAARDADLRAGPRPLLRAGGRAARLSGQRKHSRLQ